MGNILTAKTSDSILFNLPSYVTYYYMEFSILSLIIVLIIWIDSLFSIPLSIYYIYAVLETFIPRNWNGFLTDFSLDYLSNYYFIFLITMPI